MWTVVIVWLSVNAMILIGPFALYANSMRKKGREK